MTDLDSPTLSLQPTLEEEQRNWRNHLRNISIIIRDRRIFKPEEVDDLLDTFKETK